MKVNKVLQLLFESLFEELLPKQVSNLIMYFQAKKINHMYFVSQGF